jgi:hypothetical protein
MRARLASMASAQDEAMARQVEDFRSILAAERVALTRAVRGILELVQGSPEGGDGLKSVPIGIYSCLHLASNDAESQTHHDSSESLPNSQNHCDAAYVHFEEHFAYQQERLHSQTHSATEKRDLPSTGNCTATLHAPSEGKKDLRRLTVSFCRRVDCRSWGIKPSQRSSCARCMRKPLRIKRRCGIGNGKGQENLRGPAVLPATCCSSFATPSGTGVTCSHSASYSSPAGQQRR